MIGNVGDVPRIDKAEGRHGSGISAAHGCKLGGMRTTAASIPQISAMGGDDHEGGAKPANKIESSATD